MAEKSGDIAVIGDRDSILIAKTAGIDVYDETDGERACRLISSLAKRGYKVIFVTEPVYAQCTEAVQKYIRETYPAIIPIPDRNGTRGIGMAGIKANVEKAIGADIIFSEGK